MRPFHTLARLSAVTLIAAAALVAPPASAAPTVTGVSGDCSHGQTLTIEGTEFGIKSPAAPLKWDDAEGQTVDDHDALDAQYSHSNPGSFAGCPDPWKIQYRSAPYTAVTDPVDPPHGYSAQYIVGGHHEDDTGDHEGRDCQVTVATESDPAERWFATWYYAIDPGWPDCGGSANHKILCIQSGTAAYSNAPYPNEFFYMDFSLHPCHQYGYVGMKSQGNMASDWCELWYQNPTACNSSTPIGDGDQWRGNSPSNANWVRLEVRISNDQGSLQFLIDNHSVWYGDGRPNWVPDETSVNNGIRSLSVGGYYRHHLDGAGVQHNDAFRYFDDIYVDSSLARVVLANTANLADATIIEPQIPQTWDDGSITATANLGKLTSDADAYLFVFDPDGVPNDPGYPLADCGAGGSGAGGTGAGGAGAGAAGGSGGTGTGGGATAGGGASATPTPPTDDSGCGCRVAPRPSAPSVALLAWLAVGLGVSRRRRSG